MANALLGGIDVDNVSECDPSLKRLLHCMFLIGALPHWRRTILHLLAAGFSPERVTRFVSELSVAKGRE